MAIDNRQTITLGRWAVSAQEFLDQFIVWAEELPDGTKMTGGAKDALDRMLARAKELQTQETASIRVLSEGWSMKPGDYVLATKYSDGDPGDQFAVGFFHSMLPKLGGDRYMVVDNDGKQFRGNGFRRCEPITHAQGVWFIEHQKEIEASMRDFYYDEDGKRHGMSIWEWLAKAPVS